MKSETERVRLTNPERRRENQLERISGKPLDLNS